MKLVYIRNNTEFSQPWIKIFDPFEEYLIPNDNRSLLNMYAHYVPFLQAVLSGDASIGDSRTYLEPAEGMAYLLNENDQPSTTLVLDSANISFADPAFQSTNVKNAIIEAKTLSGSIPSNSFSGSPAHYLVSFTPSLPNTDYPVSITSEEARLWTIESKTVNSFIINSNANKSILNKVDWSISR